jgi:hypothetical protein
VEAPASKGSNGASTPDHQHCGDPVPMAAGHAHAHGVGALQGFRHLTEWFEEYRLYHRRDGRVHEEGDDLLSATRYAVMMLPFARCLDIPNKPCGRVRGLGGRMAA